MTDTEFNAVKAFLSAYRYTELDLRVRRAELTRLTARKEALILEGNTDLLFHLEHAICAAKDAIRVLCTRQAGIDLHIELFCGLLVTVWLIINELISVLENLAAIGVPGFPRLNRLLSRLKSTVNEKEDEHDT